MSVLLPGILGWKRARSAPSGIWAGATASEELYCVVSLDNKSIVSANAASWTSSTIDTGDPSAFFYDVARNGSIFVAVGSAVCSSPDGGVWTKLTVPAGQWRAIEWNGAIFCAVSEASGECMVSPDAGSWTAGTIGGGILQAAGLAWTGLNLVTVGNNNTNKAATSTNGLSWIPRTLPRTANWVDVAYGNNMLVAVATGINNQIAVSADDGATWSEVTLPTSASWNAVEFNGDYFCIVGNSADACVSSDALNWSTVAMPAFAEWDAICSKNGQFIVLSLNSNYIAVLG